MARFGSLGTQYFDSDGNPLSGGLIYFYETGTTTPKATYSDLDETIANTNPVVLTAAGRQPNIFFSGSAKGVLATSADVIVETRDPIGATSQESAFEAWNSVVTYQTGDIVTGSNGEYYASLIDDNQGNDPTVSPSEWELFADYLLASQTTIPSGQLALGSDPEGMEGLDTTPKGTIPVGSGTTTTTLAAGTNGYVLTTDSTQPKGVKWAQIPGTARDYQAFTSSGTWTKPAGAEFVLAEIWSGGAGGAGNSGTNPAGGGAGGEYIYKLFPASALGATESVTIGSGGAGGASASAGSAGGSTSFGSHITATGGNPGTTSNAVFATVPRAATATSPVSASVMTAIMQTQAGYGGAGSFDGTGYNGGNTTYGGGGGGGSGAAGGSGGASTNGGAGGAGATTGTATAGSAPAGGGGGCSGGGTGGAGARGEARVWTW